jgi:ribonuclease J
MLIDIDEINNYPMNQVVIITTGSQGEPMSALTRMSTANHRKVGIVPGDTIIISATPIPGNEKLVSRTIDNLLKILVNYQVTPVATGDIISDFKKCPELIFSMTK